jgi:hypothetical protein
MYGVLLTLYIYSQVSNFWTYDADVYESHIFELEDEDFSSFKYEEL